MRSATLLVGVKPWYVGMVYNIQRLIVSFKLRKKPNSHTSIYINLSFPSRSVSFLALVETIAYVKT